MTCPRVPVRDEAGTGADRETVWVWGLHKCWEGWRAGRALLVHLGALQPRGWDLAAEFRAASPRSPECLPRVTANFAQHPGGKGVWERTLAVWPQGSPQTPSPRGAVEVVQRGPGSGEIFSSSSVSGVYSQAQGCICQTPTARSSRRYRVLG